MSVHHLGSSYTAVQIQVVAAVNAPCLLLLRLFFVLLTSVVTGAIFRGLHEAQRQAEEAGATPWWFPADSCFAPPRR